MFAFTFSDATVYIVRAIRHRRETRGNSWRDVEVANTTPYVARAMNPAESLIACGAAGGGGTAKNRGTAGLE